MKTGEDQRSARTWAGKPLAHAAGMLLSRPWPKMSQKVGVTAYEAGAVSSPTLRNRLDDFERCGVGAEVANAVYNACDVRVRDYPITLDKIIRGMPPTA